MKKPAIFALILTLLCGSLFAQKTPVTKPEETEKPAVPTTPQTQKVQDYSSALSLARYGYATKNALCLITAADMMYKLNVSPLPASARQNPSESAPTDSKPAKPDLANPEQLLIDARRLAKGDATVLALANRVKPALPTRGAVGGPKRSTTSVSANSVDVFQIRFRGYESAIVALRGDGDTDLDLYIYDDNGNLIARDDDYTDGCVASWTPRYTGLFTIRVKNRGSVYNRYTLATN
ncbi:hypothetical protein [Larkinella punicea]|uniref:Peptidase C-terminal archaeal/bacterial domain-containing protein n=1 Tax=Larkinella punicea TaxID=2315727 RepID=A0A368JI87_9BACT|nr:hypothetical protein [Larkinella punicea]RCR66394.1 hypothetical protein DUE52_27185 [Larkinella punicea]